MARQNKKFSVLNHVLKTMFLCCFVVFLALNIAKADETTANSSTGLTSGTQDCEFNDENYKKIAENANTLLIEMKKSYDTYTQKLEAMKQNSGVCFAPSKLDLNTDDKKTWHGKAWQFIKGLGGSIADSSKIMYEDIANSDLAFNANDVAGASEGKKYSASIEKNFDAISNSLKGTHIDIKSHIQSVNSVKSEYINNIKERKEDIASAKTEEEKAEAQARYDVLAYKIEALNKCQKEFNSVMNPRKALSASREKAHQYLASLSGQVERQCTCTNTGELLSCKVKDDTFQEDDLVESNCKQLSEYQADFSICPICGIFETILIADQKLSDGAFTELSDALMKLLLLGYSIFIGYQVLMLIGSPAKQTIGKFLNTLLLQGFKVALAVALLEMPNSVYDLGITPLIEGGFEFGLEMVPDDSKGVIEQFAGKYTSFDANNHTLSADFLQKIMGAVEGYNEKAAVLPAIGRSLYCNSWENKVWGVIPHWSMMIEGVLVFAFGLMIMLAVGFYLLDIAIHLGIIACLMPFLIACWPFKMTSGYTKTGFNMIMNVCFRFIIMGVLLATTVELVTSALTLGIDKGQLEELLNSNDTDSLTNAMSITGLQMLILLVCCMISMKLVSQLTRVTNRFASGGVPTGDMGSKLGGTAASIATSAGKGAANAIGKAGGAMAEAAGVTGAAKAAGGAIKGSIQNIAGKAGMGGKAKMAGGRTGGNGGGNGGGNNGGGGGSGSGSGGSNG